MNNKLQSLGLIEVIGFPPAIEAADAALKAANIKLGGIEKVGSGIVTVELYGDVGAVNAAVAAGGSAASKIGQLRATHVIPRVEESLIGMVLTNKECNTQKLESKSEVNKSFDEKIKDLSIEEKTEEVHSSKVKKDETAEYDALNRGPDIHIGSNTDKSSAINIQTDSLETESKNKIFGKDEYTKEKLSKKSNLELKMLIATLGIKASPESLKYAKKDKLIQTILKFTDKSKGES